VHEHGPILSNNVGGERNRAGRRDTIGDPTNQLGLPGLDNAVHRYRRRGGLPHLRDDLFGQPEPFVCEAYS
jgi:hypothetical protein